MSDLGGERTFGDRVIEPMESRSLNALPMCQHAILSTTMDGLNWVFSLYAVVLGLTLAEVLTGFARSIRTRHSATLDGHRVVRLGLLTPLFAIWLMFDITSFWLVAWTVQDTISVNPLTLAFGLLASSFYYVAGSWVFPEEDTPTTDLNNHYFRLKSTVFSLVFASNLLSYMGRSWLTGSFGIPGFEHYDYAMFALYYLLQLAGILVRGKTANLAVLVCLLLLILDYISGIGTRIMHAIL